MTARFSVSVTQLLGYVHAYAVFVSSCCKHSALDSSGHGLQFAASPDMLVVQSSMH